jgi:phosphoserine phosphatase RsbX
MASLKGARRWRRAPEAFHWGMAACTKEGETSSGDRHVIGRFAGGLLAGVVDGLGHGDEAALAASRAVRVLEAEPEAPVVELMRLCHEALRQTRGAVVSLASFRAADQTLAWVGVGNVEGVVLRAGAPAAAPRESLLLRNGVVGFQLPTLTEAVVSLSPGDVVVLATDGLDPAFTTELAPGEAPQALAERLLLRYAKGTDDALALVVEFLGSRT